MLDNLIKRIKRTLTSDDAYHYTVMTEPRYHLKDKSSFRGPFTRRKAFRIAEQYIVAFPLSQVSVICSAKNTMSWPPRTAMDTLMHDNYLVYKW